MNKRRALTRIHERERNQLTGLVYTRTSSWMLAEDIVGDVFAKVWHLRRKLPEAFWHDLPVQHAYLVSMVLQEIANHWRRRPPLTFAEYFAVVPEEDNLILADDGGIEAIIEACDTPTAAALLTAALKQCTPTQLQLIELRYVQNLSPAEVAKQLGLTRRQYTERHDRLMHHLLTLFGKASNDVSTS